jgi:hypothetical protein
VDLHSGIRKNEESQAWQRMPVSYLGGRGRGILSLRAAWANVKNKNMNKRLGAQLK